MSEKKRYVCHISGQGDKYEVYDEALNSWRIRNEIEFDFWLPRSEYRPCDPPEVWEDVTEECTVNEYGSIQHNGVNTMVDEGYRRRKVPRCPHHVMPPAECIGKAFIVERRKS